MTKVYLILISILLLNASMLQIKMPYSAAGHSLPLAATINPTVATSATSVNAHSFTANWQPVAGAVGYKLDVATTNTFFLPTTTTIAKWDFPHSPDNDTVDIASPLNAKKVLSSVGTNGMTFSTSGLTSMSAKATGWNGGPYTKYWEIRINTTGFYNLYISSKQKSMGNGPINFALQYKIRSSDTWTDILSYTVSDNYNASGPITDQNLPLQCENKDTVYIRWVKVDNFSFGGAQVNTNGSSFIDDIIVTGNPTSCINGYHNLDINSTITTKPVIGVFALTTYYYRVRAYDASSVSVNSNFISVTTQLGNPLSVNFLHFTGERKDNRNILRWSTATETNNKGFELQRSVDGSSYQPIRFINSTAMGGNSVAAIDYTYNDYELSGDKQFYRLKQIDQDEKTNFSPIVIIQDKKQEKRVIVTLYPNPALGTINLVIDAHTTDKLTCLITDVTGRILKQLFYDPKVGNNILNIDIADLSIGMYYLKSTTANGTITTQKFIVRQN